MRLFVLLLVLSTRTVLAVPSAGYLKNSFISSLEYNLSTVREMGITTYHSGNPFPDEPALLPVEIGNVNRAVKSLKVYVVESENFIKPEQALRFSGFATPNGEVFLNSNLSAERTGFEVLALHEGLQALNVTDRTYNYSAFINFVTKQKRESMIRPDERPQLLAEATKLLQDYTAFKGPSIELQFGFDKFDSANWTLVTGGAVRVGEGGDVVVAAVKQHLLEMMYESKGMDMFKPGYLDQLFSHCLMERVKETGKVVKVYRSPSGDDGFYIEIPHNMPALQAAKQISRTWKAMTGSEF